MQYPLPRLHKPVASMNVDFTASTSFELRSASNLNVFIFLYSRIHFQYVCNWESAFKHFETQLIQFLSCTNPKRFYLETTVIIVSPYKTVRLLDKKPVFVSNLSSILVFILGESMSLKQMCLLPSTIAAQEEEPGAVTAVDVRQSCRGVNGIVGILGLYLWCSSPSGEGPLGDLRGWSHRAVSSKPSRPLYRCFPMVNMSVIAVLFSICLLLNQLKWLNGPRSQAQQAPHNCSEPVWASLRTL